MTLVKQLWLAIALVMSAAFGTSLMVNVYAARHYLQQQLQLKNIDNANALALSLSQLGKDPAAIELLVSAQFDLGHYRFIRITAPGGKTLVEKAYDKPLEGVPHWFADLFPIRTEPGQAQIQDGWKQYGILSLASHDQYAYQSLWDGTLRLLGWFVLGILATGALGTLMVRRITRPLLDVVSQAQALTERRFQPIPDPRTPELRAVTQAMNKLVDRLKALYAEEAERLEALRDKANHDAVTGLANRGHFLSHLREMLVGEQSGSSGSLLMVRLADLNQLNERLGHLRVDQLLRSLGQVLDDGDKDNAGQRAGRLKGGEFAVVCPDLDPVTAAQTLHARLLRDWLPQWQAECPELFHLAAVHYQHQQVVGELLTRADLALAQAQAKGPNSWHAPEGGHDRFSLPAGQWRTLLHDALTVGRLSLSFYPVLKGASGHLLHREGVLRLLVDACDQPLPAGDFMPVAARLRLTAPIDLAVVRLAIGRLHDHAGDDVAVNLSAESIADFGFRQQLTRLLLSHKTQCSRLLFEVPEYGVSRHFDAFRDLANRLKALGCRVGIEYFSLRFVEGDKLASLGLDYLKVDPGYVRSLGGNAGNQEFLAGLCAMAHALGIAVIAQGVESTGELPLLTRLGFDGATGPGIQWPESD